MNRNELGSFLGLSTDGGMHMGVAAGGEHFASGTIAKGPEGGVYAHGTTATRSVAAGAGVAGGYGTHFYSSTFYHSQALGVHGWFGAHPVFTPAWCEAHPWAWRPAAYTSAAWATAAWATATAATLSSTIEATAAPVYYVYGDNVTYQDGSVFYGSQPVATAAQYYQQAAGIADTGAAASPPDDTQWLPLGVFSLAPPEQKTPEMIFQLAVNKDGTIRGNFHDQASPGESAGARRS